MSESLDQRISTFENLQWIHVVILVDIIVESNLKTIHHIEKRFAEKGQYFDKTTAFLVSLGLIKHMEDKLILQKQLIHPSNFNLRSVVLSQLATHDSRYSHDIAHYFINYIINGNTASYRPNHQVRSAESAVRNFLLEIGVIAYSQNKNIYIVSPEHIHFYSLIREKAIHISPHQVTKNIEAKNQLGLAAEIVVIASEQARVGQQLSRYVHHVALKNALAGYDILSVAAGPHLDTTPRFIEVKAVSPESFQFYWTSNEIKIAQLLGPLYYLYLVPVENGNNICSNKIVMIPNPHATVFGSDEKWMVETNVFLCRPKNIQDLNDPQSKV